MDEDLANFRVDTKSNVINGTTDYSQTNIYATNIENCAFNQRKKTTIDTVTFLKQNKLPTINCHRVIAPKLGDMNSIKSQNKYRLESIKMRDEKRRVTHNEIERRRRNKINNWIYKLKGLMPEKPANSLSPEVNCKLSSTESKSQILIRTYNYIQYMQKELKSLRHYIRENDQLRYTSIKSDNIKK